jgi:MFS family permease
MHFSLSAINKSIKILLFFLFVVNTAAALWTPIFSVYVISHVVGATLATIGIMSVVYSLVRSVLQIPIAKYLDGQAGEKDDFFVIFSGIFIASVCSFGLLFVQHIWQLGLVQMLWGVADACTMAAYYSIFSHHIDQKSAAFEWSLYSVGGITVAMSLGGLIGGFAAQYFGFSVIFIAAGCLNILGLVLLGALYPHMKTMRDKKEPRVIEMTEMPK